MLNLVTVLFVRHRRTDDISVLAHRRRSTSECKPQKRRRHADALTSVTDSVRWGSGLPHGNGLFWGGEGANHSKVYGTLTVGGENTAGSIEMAIWHVDMW